MLAKLFRLTWLVLGMTCAAFSVAAQEIELRSPDETIMLRGQLVEFDGENYTISTTLGTLIVKASLLECFGDDCPYIKPPASIFTVSGSRSMGDALIPDLLNAYGESLDARISAVKDGRANTIIMTDNEEDDLAKVSVVPSSSSEGLADLLQGESLVALSTRPTRRRETQAFATSGLGNIRSPEQERVVALDGLLIVTSPDNPVRAISELNAALVFSGTITNWSELGGRDAPINVYTRSADSGTTEVFNAIIMRPQGVAIRRDAVVLASDNEMADIVSKDANGIGFTSFINQDDAKALAIEGVCGLQTPPSEFTIKTEEYPLTRRLFAYTVNQEDLPIHVGGFLDFTSSDKAQEIVGKAGFVNQAITAAGVDEQGLRFASAIVANRSAFTVPELQEMTRQMLSSDRLSVTFRFETGSSILDTRAQDDLQRLADILNEDASRGKIVQLMGFTDSVGDPILNKQLSLRRANQVRGALLALDPTLAQTVRFETLGYGEISPLGCNETLAGRLINRRVEVWVREDT